jgi:O-antigen/teichoic acid export membrane protein
MTITKRTGMLARVSWAAAVLNLVLNLALVPVWGMLASAWATAASYLFLTVAYLWLGQRLWRVEYDFRRAITISLSALVFTIGASALPDVASVPTLLLKLGYILVFLLVLVVFRAAGPQDWDRIRAQLRSPPLEEIGT